MVTEKNKNMESKVMDEVKRLGINLVPFLSMTGKGYKMLRDINPEYSKNPKTIKDWAYVGVATCSLFVGGIVGFGAAMGILVGGAVHVGTSARYNTFNFSRWDGIQQERVVRQEDYRARVLEKVFGVLDSDGDGVLSREEFRGMKEGVPKGYNFYGRLNSGLNLGEGNYPWK